MYEATSSGFVVSGKCSLDSFSFSLYLCPLWGRVAPCADVADIRTHLDVADIRTRLKGADIHPPYPDTQTMPPYKIRDEAPPVVQKTYTFTLWLVRKVENFPRSHRFTVGDRLTAHALDLMALLTEAAYSRRKEPLLESARVELYLNESTSLLN